MTLLRIYWGGMTFTVLPKTPPIVETTALHKRMDASATNWHRAIAAASGPRAKGVSRALQEVSRSQKYISQRQRFSMLWFGAYNNCGFLGEICVYTWRLQEICITSRMRHPFFRLIVYLSLGSSRQRFDMYLKPPM